MVIHSNTQTEAHILSWEVQALRQAECTGAVELYISNVASVLVQHHHLGCTVSIWCDSVLSDTFELFSILNDKSFLYWWLCLPSFKQIYLITDRDHRYFLLLHGSGKKWKRNVYLKKNNMSQCLLRSKRHSLSVLDMNMLKWARS